METAQFLDKADLPAHLAATIATWATLRQKSAVSLKLRYPDGVARGYAEVTDLDTGIVFRFYDDRVDPSRLHIGTRWGTTPADAIEAFVTGIERTVWLEAKRCFESIGMRHTVVWLRMNEAHSRVLVITCVPHTARRTEQGED